MICGAKLQILSHNAYQHCNKWMNNCNKRSGAGKKSMPRTHNTDKVATALLKDQVTVVLGVGLTVVAQHDTTYIGGDSIVANSNFFSICC